MRRIRPGPNSPTGNIVRACTQAGIIPKSRLSRLVAAGIRNLERIAAGVEEAFVINHPRRVRHERIRRDERAQRRVIVADVVVKQSGRVGLVAGEGAVGLEVAGGAAFRSVRIVRSVGCFG